MSKGRHKPYPKYHPSGTKWLGDIPSHWTAKRLGQFFEERREKVSDKHFAPLSVTMQGIVPQLETAAKTDDGDNRKLVRANDFVINSRSDRKGSAGVSPLDGSVSLISTVLTPRNIEPRYVHHLLRSYPFQEEYYRFGKGIVADLWSTNYSEMKNILIPELPLPEQTQIAKFLDHETAKIDRLIEKQEELIRLLKEKRQAVISHAVTKGLNPHAPLKDSGIEWLGQVPTHWKVHPIRYLITKIEQGWSPQCDNRPADDNEWGVLKVGCGNRETFDPSEQKALPANLRPEVRYEIKAGDILLSRGNSLELVGMATFIQQVRPRLLLSDLLYRFQTRPESADGEFLVYSLRSPHVRFQIESEATGTSPSMKKIGQDNIRGFIIAIPPLSEQRGIVEHIKARTAKLDVLTSEAQQAATLLQERRTALISAAVTGKIDVRHWQPPAVSARSEA